MAAVDAVLKLIVTVLTSEFGSQPSSSCAERAGDLVDKQVESHSLPSYLRICGLKGLGFGVCFGVFLHSLTWQHSLLGC